MKALVLPGGSGSRLRPITHNFNQATAAGCQQAGSVLWLGGAPQRWHRRSRIVVGDAAPAIRAAVGNGRASGLDVTYIRQHAPLGLAYAVLVARDYLGSDKPVQLQGSGNWAGGPFKQKAELL